MSSSSSISSAVPVLETPHLLLRGYRTDDYDAWVAMAKEYDYYRYLSPEPIGSEEVWKLLLRSAGHWALMGFGFWAVEEKATGQFIGAIGYADFKREITPPIVDTPEIGWVLAPSAHGKGYATEGVTAALAWGDARFNRSRTVCIIHYENLASLRVAEKFGYREYARTTYKGEPTVMLERIV